MIPEPPKPSADEKPTAGKGQIGVLRGLTVGQKAEVGLFILGVLYTIYIARGLLMPIFLALLLAALLQPFVQKMLGWKIPEKVGAAIVVLVFVGALGMAIYELSNPIAEWVEKGPLLLRRANYKLEKLKQSLLKAKEKTEQIEEMTNLEGGKEKVVVKKLSLSERILSQTWVFLGGAAVMIVLVFFLLSQGRQTLHRLASGFEGPDTGEKLTVLLVKIQRDIAAYLRTVIVINTAVGVITATFTALLGLPGPIMLGVMAGVANFIPYLGPAVTFLLISVVSLATFDDWFRILPPPLVYLGFTLVEGNFITPMILGSRLTLNPIVIFLAILFWGWVWGAAGVFLAVPILAAMKIIAQSVPRLGPVSLIIDMEKNNKIVPLQKQEGGQGIGGPGVRGCG